MSESVILCEGFLDRAFWAGWLDHLGCTIPSHRGTVCDALGRPVRKGQYMYRSRTDKFVRVVPCHGKSRIQPAARERLGQRRMRPRLTRLVINVDPDVDVSAPSAATGLTRRHVHAFVREFDRNATETADGNMVLDDGDTLVSLVRWEANDAAASGLPNQQTLERLVCAAVVAAFPDRGPAVQTWLDSRPNAAQAGPKEFGWSYMAGWYADHGCEGFYRALWGEAVLAAQLKSRLQACGAWRVAEALAQ